MRESISRASPAASGPDAADVGIALARTIDVDRIVQEVAHHVRRAVSAEALVIALAEPEGAALQVAHRSGYEESPEALVRRLSAEWSEALRGGADGVGVRGRASEVTVALRAGAGEGAVGVMTVLADLGAGDEEARRALATIAAHTAAAVERAWLVRRALRRRRIETVGEVVAGVAHEFRNPLFGISSAAQLLRFRAREDPVMEKNIGRILRDVERLNRMVTELLEYGRPLSLAPAAGNPDDVWDHVLDDQRGRLQSRALAVHRTRASPPVRCAIDADHLAQVFVHLLGNAVDAAPEASDLTLESAAAPHGGWRCRLTNGGAPIPPDLLPRVFDVFFSTKPGSSGLGLPLCQRIVEEHHGTIGIESSAESGTTVTVVLPGAGDR